MQKKIWWDLRVHPFFGTVEFRICDVPMTVDETIAITALFQCICVKLFKLKSQNLNFIGNVINKIKQFVNEYPGIDFFFFSKVDHSAIDTIT